MGRGRVRGRATATEERARFAALERVDPTDLGRLEPERYKVQFTATEEYVRLVDEAKALLSHAVPNAPDPETMSALPQAVSRTRPGRTTALEQHAQPKDALDEGTEPPRQRGRHIPAAVRRTVVERDGNRCSYLDANGTRCRDTHRLEFHHLKPFATGGEHCVSNLTLRCAAHNALAAEQDFGRELIEHRKGSLRHERFGSSGE
jgi:hypothetical protein